MDLNDLHGTGRAKGFLNRRFKRRFLHTFAAAGKKYAADGCLADSVAGPTQKQNNSHNKQGTGRMSRPLRRSDGIFTAP